jgi:hypothetical protein
VVWPFRTRGHRVRIFLPFSPPLLKAMSVLKPVGCTPSLHGQCPLPLTQVEEEDGIKFTGFNLAEERETGWVGAAHRWWWGRWVPVGPPQAAGPTRELSTRWELQRRVGAAKQGI